MTTSGVPKLGPNSYPPKGHKKRRAEDRSSALLPFLLLLDESAPFASLVPIGVYLGKVLPLVRYRSFLKNRLYGANRLTGAAVDAFLRVDVELFFLFEIGLTFRRVNTIYRANVDACGVFGVDTGLGNNVGHLLPPGS